MSRKHFNIYSQCSCISSETCRSDAKLVYFFKYCFFKFSIILIRIRYIYRTGKRLITDETRKEMKKVLREIQDGTFASEFMQEFSAGRKAKFLATRRVESEHQLEKTGAELREMMSWLKK